MRRGKVLKVASSTASFIFLFLIALTPGSVAQNGTTYPIVEPDMMTEIQKDAAKITKKQLYEMREKVEKRLLNTTPEFVQYLPPAKKSYSYEYDVVYTLPFNIPKVDRNGRVIGILYPKGFTFHVLRYIPYDFIPLVIFDLKDPLQREYIKEKYGNDFSVKLLSVSGTISEILKFARQLKRPVYYDLWKINKRFNLKNTISIVSRSGKNRDDVFVRVIGEDQIKEELSKKQKGGK